MRCPDGRRCENEAELRQTLYLGKVSETQEQMLEKKTQEFPLPKNIKQVQRHGRRAWLGVLTAAVLIGSAAAQTTPAPAQSSSQTATQTTTPETPTPSLKKGRFGAVVPVTYDNKYEVYGGINLMTFQAGQDLPKRMNLGGGELLGTYWLKPKLGLGAEWRGEWGTTPIKPNPYFNGRALADLQMVMGGAQYRGPKNQYAALNYHAYAGMAHGTFDHSTQNIPAVYLPQVGLYPNQNAFVSALGGSVDINKSKNWAFRLSPDLMIEHFGTETRYFFAISGGVVYRIGKKQ
jgi:hypothetical protein